MELERKAIRTSVRMHVCVTVCKHQVFFANRSWMDEQVLLIFTQTIEINITMMTLTRSQYYKVKYQGQYAIM